MNDTITKFFNILKNTKEPAYDIESNGLRWQNCYVCGYSISDGAEAVYIPVRHEGGGNIQQIEEFELALNKAIQEHTGKIIGHNIKFDMHFSQNHGVNLGNKVVDTMTMECLLDENRRSFALGNVCKSYDIAPKLGKTLYEHIGARFGVKPDASSMGHFYRLAGNDPLAVEYAAGDTLTTKQLWEAQKKELYRQELDVVYNMENELSYVLQKMERRGIAVDPTEAIKVKAQIEDMYIEAFTKIPLGEDFTPINIRSGKDLREYFETCDITDWPMTAPTDRHPDGQPSFNSKYLATHEEGLNILNARKLGHLKSSFLDVLDDHIHHGRIHTTFNQARGETHGTKGGRLSSSNPNKQQVPKRDKVLGQIYRRMFTARPSHFLIEFDYSQAEPRLYTHYSDEPSLLQGYNSTPFVDMHSIAAQYMNVGRDTAKSLNLGIMYTMGAAKLAAQLGIPYEQALSILKRWHRTFPKVSEFTKRASTVAEQRGYVRTILGRRRRFPDPRWAYRAANAIVQGGSADIMKWKLVEIDRYLVKNNLEEVCNMLLTIHDSIVFEIHNDYKHLIETLKDIMERVQVKPFDLKVPFIAEWKAGDNWASATYGN